MTGFLRKKLSLRGLLQASGIVLCALSLFGFAGCAWWVFDLVSHFRVQYLLILAAFVPLALWTRQKRLAMLFLSFSFLNLLLVVPLYLPQENRSGIGETYRMMLLNVNMWNRDYDRVMTVIREHDPDFFVVEEFNSRWHRAMIPMRAAYPYAVADPREDCFGIALFSRVPFEETRVFYIGDAGVPSIMGRVTLNGETVTIFATHPLPPAGAAYSSLRDQQIDLLPELLNTCDRPLILAGDLNVSPWACRFSRLLHETHLLDSARGFGFQPSWPTKPALLRIPIDHFLHSPEVGIADRFIGPSVGSDHLPVVVDFFLIPAPQEAGELSSIGS